MAKKQKLLEKNPSSERVDAGLGQRSIYQAPSGDQKTIESKPPVDIVQKIKNAQKQSYTNLLEYCLKTDPLNNEEAYFGYGSDFANSSDKVFQEIENFHMKIGPMPLLAVILLWARNISLDKVFGARHVMIMQDLLENELIQYHDPMDDKLLTLGEFSGFGHMTTIDQIRCYKEWSIDKREDCVKFYVEFANWLSQASFGYIQKAIDPDRSSTQNRWLPFDIYITIIKELADRERILAKIFYLGRSRSLEEVLSLKIEDIDSRKGVLHFPEEDVRYSKHVFEDLKEYIGARKRGFVFVGRQGDRIDHTVPYRALKTVSTKLKLDPSFTFKDFVRNV